jgi:hypothetical protein
MKTPWGNLVRTRLDMTKEDMFSAPAAATLIGISTAKAYKAIAAGHLPAVDLNAEVSGHPCWRLTKPEILEYVRRIEEKA